MTDYLDEAQKRCALLLAYLEAHEREHGPTGLLGGAGYHLEQLELDLSEAHRERHKLRQELDRARLSLEQARAERDELRRQHERLRDQLHRLGPGRDMGAALAARLEGR